MSDDEVPASALDRYFALLQDFRPTPPEPDSAEGARRAQAAVLEKEALARLVPWGNDLKDEDIRFAEWATEVAPDELFLGALYEFARESETVRALAWLDKYEPPSPDDFLEALAEGSSPPERPLLLVRGIRPQDFLLRGHWWHLTNLGEALADNLPFSHVRQDRTLIERILRCSRQHAWGQPFRRRRQAASDEYHAPAYGEPLVLAPASAAAEFPTSAETNLDVVTKGSIGLGSHAFLDDEHKKGRMLRWGGQETFLLQIDWRNFNDSELRAAFADLLRLRPSFLPSPGRFYNPSNDLEAQLEQGLSAWRLQRLASRLSGESKPPLAWPRYYWHKRAAYKASGTLPAAAFRSRLPSKARREPVDADWRAQAFSKARKRFQTTFERWFGFPPPDNVDRMTRRDLP